ncbi:MAG: DUF362 domain-containing protein [Dehalococcoidia bacterium]|nr:DUF362 domain-containing protein [Dehalococcoidia bacterium]
MIYKASEFVFEPARQVARARRVLIKPSAAYPLPYPVTTSRETMAAVIRGIRRVSEADILILEGSWHAASVRSIYRGLGYDFPRVISLDVNDCILVEVENPLAKPFALANFWVPNIVLSCDYLITVAPFKVAEGEGALTIANLLGLLPASKYGESSGKGKDQLERLGLNNVIADLYFTLPFDLGIVDARMKFYTGADPTKGEIEEYGYIMVGEPFQVDREAVKATGTQAEYLRLISMAKVEIESVGQ